MRWDAGDGNSGDYSFGGWGLCGGIHMRVKRSLPCDAIQVGPYLG